MNFDKVTSQMSIKFLRNVKTPFLKRFHVLEICPEVDLSITNKWQHRMSSNSAPGVRFGCGGGLTHIGHASDSGSRFSKGYDAFNDIRRCSNKHRCVTAGREREGCSGLPYHLRRFGDLVARYQIAFIGLV